MMHDVIERFRYRFELWRRERREDSMWGGKWPELSPEPRDRISYYLDDPKRAELLIESTLKSIGRFAGAYFGIIVLASQICLVISRFIPSARFALGVIFLVFTALWTLVMIVSEIDLRKVRNHYRQQQATESSNQSMQLTADRRDDPISIHEPPYTPSFPRFRQR
jgi:hypothetical protein